MKYFDDDYLLLISCPNQDGGIVSVNNDLLITKVDNLRTTGLYIDEEVYIRALQTEPVELLIYDVNGELGNIILSNVKDIHDVLWHNKQLYIVSTIENEVIVYENYTIKKRFKLTGENDSWHLNCLENINGRICVSAFGEFSLTREYKNNSLGRGIVFELETGNRIIQGLSQPHTPKVYGNKLYICDSETKRVLVYKDGVLVNEFKFSLYPRGLLITELYIFVGLSASRNNVDINFNENAAVVIINMISGQYETQIELPGKEVYDIKLINKHIFERCVNKTDLTYTELKDEFLLKTNQLGSIEQEFLSKCRELEISNNELHSLYGSISWKITKPLRKISTLARKIRNKLGLNQ